MAERFFPQLELAHVQDVSDATLPLDCKFRSTDLLDTDSIVLEYPRKATIGNELLDSREELRVLETTKPRSQPLWLRDIGDANGRRDLDLARRYSTSTASIVAHSE